jgi:ABC-type uncharacterized transport system permease subunit
MLWLISGHQLTVSEISTFCIAASYLVALVLEAIRPLWLARARYFLALSFLVAGIVAHLLYLAFVARGAMFSGQGVFVSWADWSLIAALLLVGAATGLMIKRPQNTVAVFLLPMVLVLIGVAELCKEMEPFKGLALLIGTVSVGLGFSTGIMYLIQSNRLKNKKGPSSGLRLPSLEWLQRFNREALLLSAILLGIGVASGVILGAQPGKELSPTDPAILSSSMMFLWIVGACIFEVVYQPARQGRKVAYVTLANFVFLVLVLTLVLYSGHAGE